VERLTTGCGDADGDASAPDATGKLFRDDIVTGVSANGSGWEQYVFKKGDYNESQPADVTKADVQAFVERAIAHAKANGKEADGTWFLGSGTYGAAAVKPE